MGNAGYKVKGGGATIDASWEEEVNVSDKHLTSIAFKNLDNARIVTLYLANNQLTSLPVEIGRLTGLTKLDLNTKRVFFVSFRGLTFAGIPLSTAHV